jgi:hypothetical protein
MDAASRAASYGVYGRATRFCESNAPHSMSARASAAILISAVLACTYVFTTTNPSHMPTQETQERSGESSREMETEIEVDREKE